MRNTSTKKSEEKSKKKSRPDGKAVGRESLNFERRGFRLRKAMRVPPSKFQFSFTSNTSYEKAAGARDIKEKAVSWSYNVFEPRIYFIIYYSILFLSIEQINKY